MSPTVMRSSVGLLRSRKPGTAPGMARLPPLGHTGQAGPMDHATVGGDLMIGTA
jgi:hypothetical protein